MSKSPEDDYLLSLQQNQAVLDAYMNKFSELAANETDDSTRGIEAMLVKYADVMKNLYKHIDTMTRLQIGLNNKVERLIQMIQTLPEVRMTRQSKNR